jgi:meso-butanediol dehydrogenase/(S,S)-butanediol dehydrogenase/diacetyl reductase
VTGLLEAKVALVTGAASGIGRATAQLFARQGAKVVLADITTAGGEDAAQGIRAEGGQAIFVRTDVGRMNEVQALVEETLAQYGRLDIIHSNAAAFTMGNAVEISEADWDRTLAVCLKAAWMLAHFSVPHMLAGGGGTIVITGSVHAIRGYAQYTAYQAAKGGLLALTRAMAADFAPTIRVNTILPGAVMTGLSAHQTAEQREIVAQMCPLRRNARPEDIAQVALFLASDMSTYMTGEALVVDGGLSSVIQIPPGL